MNPLSNLIKMMDTRLNSGRVQGPQRNRLKNLHLNMSLVEEDVNELNETRNAMNDSSLSINDSKQKSNGPPSESPGSSTTSTIQAISTPQQKQEIEPEPIKEPREGRLQSILRQSALKQLQKQKTPMNVEVEQDILNFSKINKEDLKILQHDSEEDKKSSKSSKSSPRSSDDSSDANSPRSSDQSSGNDAQEDQLPRGKNYHSVRFSVMDLQAENKNRMENRHVSINKNKKLSTFTDYISFKPLGFTSNVKINVNLSAPHESQTYYECFEFSKKTIPKPSQLKQLFKLKAQGHVAYVIETKEQVKEDPFVRQRNKTSLGQRNSGQQLPATPNSKQKSRTFSPAQSPLSATTKVIQFPSENSSPLLSSDFMQRAQSKVRQLKLIPINMDEILISSSSSSSSGSEKEKEKENSKVRSSSKPGKILDIPKLDNVIQSDLKQQSIKMAVSQVIQLQIPLKAATINVSPPTINVSAPTLNVSPPTVNLFPPARTSFSPNKSVSPPRVPPTSESTPPQKIQTKTFGGIINKALQLSDSEQEQQKEMSVPLMKKEEQKRQFNSAILHQNSNSEGEENSMKQSKNTLMRRLPQIQLQDLSLKQKLQLDLNKRLDNLLFKLKPFLEDPDDQFDHTGSSDRLSQKAMVKFKLLCTIGVGGIAFLLFILIISVISVGLSNRNKFE